MRIKLCKGRLPIFILGTGLVLLGLIAGCSFFPKEEVEEVPALVQPPEENMVTHEITQGPISEEISGSARVGSSKEMKLYFLDAGRIGDVIVENDAMVKKGQPLVSLETGDLDYKVKQAQVNLDQEEMRFEEKFGDNSENKREVQLAELNLAKTKLDLEQAQERLKAEGPLSTGLQKKALGRDIERAKLIFNQAKLQYEGLLSQAAPNSLAWRIAASGVEQARLEYRRLAEQLDKSTIRAPFDGRIFNLLVARGKKVEALDLVATIANMKGLELIADIESGKAPRLKPGMPVRVEVDEGKYETGRIIFLDQPDKNLGEKVDTYDVHIRMDNSHFVMKFDDYYNIAFITRSVKQTLLVSNDAIREDVNGKKYLRVIEGKQRHDVYIKVGIENETMTQILEGAAAGMVVIGK